MTPASLSTLVLYGLQTLLHWDLIWGVWWCPQPAPLLALLHLPPLLPPPYLAWLVPVTTAPVALNWCAPWGFTAQGGLKGWLCLALPPLRVV